METSISLQGQTLFRKQYKFSPMQFGLKWVKCIISPTGLRVGRRIELNFREIALADRYKLLRSLSHWRRKAGVGAAGTAYEVTTKAIGWGYVKERPIPDGAQYDLWIAKKNPVAWVAKGAARLLIDEPGYIPTDEGELFAFALTVAEAFPELGQDEIYELFPLDKKNFVSESLLAKAIAARK